jgi:nitroimidazol reductase NimA-like FMN-containing flavoprotein (pyridoxamine 5'-phosphate oxidase superfamily)
MYGPDADAGRSDQGARVPIFRALDRAECETLLARNNVGRLAFSLHDRVDIVPLHYVHEEGWLYLRTAPGTRLELTSHRPWIAFEVDEVEGVLDWRSVVVHGTIYPLSREGPEREAAAWERAVDLLRRLIPETATPADPVAFRTVVFRIHIDDMRGRAASTAPGDSA